MPHDGMSPREPAHRGFVVSGSVTASGPTSSFTCLTTAVMPAVQAFSGGSPEDL
jgi:hypothetical protein